MPPEPQPGETPAVPPQADKPGREREPGPKRDYGEGNYGASKQSNDATKRYVESHDVEQAARDAAPDSKAEARELERAEDAGRRRAKDDELPLLTRRLR
jgi:hypothetical protein